MKDMFLDIITGVLLAAAATALLGGIAYLSLGSGEKIGLVAFGVLCVVWCGVITYAIFILTGIASNPLRDIRK